MTSPEIGKVTNETNLNSWGIAKSNLTMAEYNSFQ